MPRNENCRKPSVSLMMPMTGSTVDLQTVDLLANIGLEFVGHLDDQARILWWRLWLLSEPLLPTPVMTVTAGRNVGFDTPLLQFLNVGRAPVAIVQSGSLGLAHLCGNSIDSWERLILVIDVVRYRVAHDATPCYQLA